MSEHRDEYNAELKSCPFCGGVAILYESFLGGWLMYCGKCGAKVPGPTGESHVYCDEWTAKETWNHRPIEDALDHALATIRATIEGWSGDPAALAGLVAEITELCGVELPDRRDPFINPRTGEVEG